MIFLKKKQPLIKLELETSLHDKNGELIYKYRRESKSFVRNFAALTYIQWRNANNNFLTLPSGYLFDTSNVDRAGIMQTGSGDVRLNQASLDAGLNDYTFGCVIGTGVTALALSDYKLDVPLANTDFSCTSQNATFPATTGNSVALAAQRVFINLSVASTTINETGLIVRNALNSFCIMIARDLVSPGEPVASGQAYTVNYILTTTL